MLSEDVKKPLKQLGEQIAALRIAVLCLIGVVLVLWFQSAFVIESAFGWQDVLIMVILLLSIVSLGASCNRQVKYS